jgi:hypothetical protein
MLIKTVRKHHQTLNTQEFSTSKTHQKQVRIMQQSIKNKTQIKNTLHATTQDHQQEKVAYATH